MRIVPNGYASTEVWRLFELFADKNLAGIDYYGYWGSYWEAFRDGYSAGVAEESK